MSQSSELRSSSYWGYPIIFAFLFIVYAPVIFTQYAFSDDYFFLAQVLQHKFDGSLHSWISGGRPLQGVFYAQVFGVLSNIGDLSYPRAFGVTGIGVVAMLVYRALSLTSLPWSAAISGALLFALIPSYQVYASWAICFPYPWACAFAVLAFNVCNQISDLRSGWIRICGAILLLSISFAIYQPAAMVFWNIAAIAWLLRPTTPLIRSIGTACTVMFSAMGFQYVLVKLLPIALWGSNNTFSRTALVQHYSKKIIWFFQEPFFASLNIFSINPLIKVALIIIALIISGFFLFYGRDLRKTLIRIGIVIFLVPASYAPNLLVAENFASYRTQVGLTGLILICVIVAIMGWIRFLRFDYLIPALCLIAVVGIALMVTRNVLTEFAIPQAIEYQIVKSALLKKEFNQTDKIYFKLAGCKKFLPTVRYDEFGFVSSAADWVPQPMSWLILNEHHSSSADLFAFDSPNLLKTSSPGCKIIDMDAILNYH